MRYSLAALIAAAALLATPALAASVSVTAIASIRSASSPSFSPDGTRVAYISNVSGTPQVWIAPVVGGAAVQVTHRPDPVQSVRWAPVGDWLAYDVAPGGGFNVQIYVAHADGTGEKLLSAGGAVNNRLDGWSRDGKWLAFETNRDNPAHFDAFLADPVTGATRPVGEARGLTTVTDVSHDGKLAIVSRLASRGDSNLYLVDLATRAETLLTPHTPPAQFGWGQFSPDGRHIYVEANDTTDMAAYGVIDLAVSKAGVKPGSIRIVAQRPDAEADSATLDDKGDWAAMIWNVAGRSELAFLNTKSGTLAPGPKLPADIAGAPTFSHDGKLLALVVSGAAAPADIWLLDVKGGRLTQLTHSPYEGVDLSSFARPALIAYRADDGLPMSGWLYRPIGAQGPGPVVFIYHGGPEGQSRPSLSADAQALVARGISVFLPNVRGSTGFGRRFVNLDNGPLRVNGVKDIASTTRALVSMGIADPRRLGIMGGSYGGYMVMAGITEYPDMFAAAADLYGVVNFETFFKHTQPWMAAISTVEYGDPATQAAMLHDLSPINRLDRVKTPLIVLHGANDTNVPVIEAEQIVAQLKARGVAVEYVLFPDEGHGWRRLPNRIRSTEILADFFERKLRGTGG
jgi:dipeptidyl aminopeptidase/acylaminoacyl peptidase